MPASRSTSRSTRSAAPAPARRPYGLFVLAVLAVVVIAAVSAAPASLATQFLPPRVHADALSGTIWIGSSENLTFDGRRAGALEWHLDPKALLRLKLDVSLHWVLGGFSARARADLDRDGFAVTDVRGGGPIDALVSLGVPAGWRGTSDIAIERAASDFARITALRGSVTVRDLVCAALAHGSPLGSYVLKFPSGSVAADGSVSGALDDAGGPLDLHGTVSLMPVQHDGMLSATLLERADATEALRKELADLASLRGRDRAGRIPVDLEFTY